MIKTMIDRLRGRLSAFYSEQSAVISAEAVIMLPTLCLFYAGIVDYFQAYEAKSTNIRAAYTISDILSREDGSIDDNYVRGMHKVFEYLTENAGHNQKIRVTVVYCDDKCGLDEAGRVLKKDWSYGVGMSPLSGSGLGAYQSQIPVMSKGDRALLVETYAKYTPAFEKVGLNELELENTIVTRPRWVPVVCFTGVNC